METRVWFCVFAVFLAIELGRGEKLDTVDVTIRCLDIVCPASDNRTRYDHDDEATTVPSNNNSTVSVNQIASKKRRDTQMLYGITAVISSVFTALAIVVQLLTAHMTHHAKVMLCLTISLFALSCSYALRIFVSSEHLYVLKMTFFALQYVGALSTFFWMSVLAFDLWRVFANLQAIPLTRRQKNWRFFAKCAYAWGIPILMWILIIVITHYPRIQRTLNITLNFQDAWFSNVYTSFIFFFLPLIVILVENVIFFLLTIINIKKASCGTEILNNSSRNKLFKVFVKLFLVMGLCWIMEIVSWLCDNVFKLKVDEAVWYVTDVINLLQGFFIFLIYVCKKGTLASMKRRLLCQGKTENQSRFSKSSIRSDDDTITVNLELTEVPSRNPEKMA